MTIATPSAKSHERVTGRWVRDFEINNSRERLVYYVKVAVGSPVPWLMWAYTALVFLSRAGVEIAAWAAAILTMIYIIADRASSTREFRFFRLGGDFFLLGFLLVAIVSAFNTNSSLEAIATLGGVRWVFLLYLIAYAWELFPGLNRLFSIMIVASVVAAAYAIWQHFTGVDLISGNELPAAPVPGAIFFTPTSFFNTPEILGTLLAVVLPFPAAAYLCADPKASRGLRYSALALILFLSLAILWTYRPGMWFAALSGLVVVILMQARRAFGLVAYLALFVGIVSAIFYGSPARMLDSVQATETVRADHQREQINTQVALWETSNWIGVGRKALDAGDYDPGTGNVYFQVLAESGLLGLAFYLLFVLGFLLATYRIFQEIPSTHYWHRVLISSALASQLAFHIAGLYWSTLSEALVVNLFVLIVAAVSYLSEHYSRGLVTDDHCL